MNKNSINKRFVTLMIALALVAIWAAFSLTGTANTPQTSVASTGTGTSMDIDAVVQNVKTAFVEDTDLDMEFIMKAGAIPSFNYEEAIRNQAENSARNVMIPLVGNSELKLAEETDVPPVIVEIDAWETVSMMRVTGIAQGGQSLAILDNQLVWEGFSFDELQATVAKINHDGVVMTLPNEDSITLSLHN